MKYFPVLVFCVLLISGCTSDKPQPVSKEQWKVFAYLPADTDYLLYTNFTELRKTEHWKDLPQTTPDKIKWFRNFKEQTGVGLDKGISEFYTATTWNGNNVMAVTFNENLDKIKGYFENKGNFLPEKINGKTVYYPVENPQTKFYFPDPSLLLIIKNVEYLSQIITGKNESLKNNKRFMHIINDIKSKNQYWFAANKGTYAAALVQQLTGLKDLKSNNIVSSIDNISLAADFSEDIQLQSVIACKDEKNAYLLSAGIRSAIVMDIFSAKNQFLGELLKNLEIKRESKTINLGLTLSEKDINELKKRQTGNNL